MTLAGKYVRFAPADLPDSRVVRLQRLHPRSIVKAPISTILVPRPQSAGFPYVRWPASPCLNGRAA